jgi:hypothetical protein
MRFTTPLQRAEITNIIEEDGKPTSFRLDEIQFTSIPWSIQTFKVVPKLNL